MRGQRSGSNLEKTLRLKNKQFCTSRNALIFASFCFTPYSSPSLPLVRHKLHVWEPTVLALVEKSWIGQGRRDQFSSSSRSIQQHNKVFSFCSIHRLLSCKSTVHKIIFLKMATVLIRCPQLSPSPPCLDVVSLGHGDCIFLCVLKLRSNFCVLF